ncbi:ATP-binding protein [Lichenicola sp.]|uniref:ATP-binding response regulator n=1 Tax=Lichenicola sp. TaxID=2804529 RepID=UPI003B005995
MLIDPFRPPAAGLPKVLLVDDEPDILVALEDMLEDEFSVLATVSPHEALAMLERHPDVAVIVSDQRMPGMTGDAFLARARNLTEAEALLLTGYADLSAVVAALNDGRISGYAHKPWEPAALLAMIRQAAQRARLAQALRTERMLLRGLMDSADDGLSFKDLDGRFLRLNAVAAARLGHDVEACVGRTERELLAGQHDQEATAASPLLRELDSLEGDDRRALEGRGHATSVTRPVEREGRVHWMERLRGPLRDGAGQPRALATFERDVSARRAMEDRLRQADRMQALGTMAGGVAHDFNNLLTAILGSLELAQRTSTDDARMKRLIETATAAAERGAALTQRLLSFSRQRETASVAVEVNALVQAMDDLLTRSIDRPGIRITQDFDAALPCALIDPAQLELALLNLCINARDAMNGRGTITLATRLLRAPDHADGARAGGHDDSHQLMAGAMPPGDVVAVRVQDTGVGMTPEVAARIFEPFFTTKEIGRGTGLGLSMVYGFMQQSGGAVRLRTAPGAGTSFELCLPCAPGSADIPSAASLPA